MLERDVLDLMAWALRMLCTELPNTVSSTKLRHKRRDKPSRREPHQISFEQLLGADTNTHVSHYSRFMSTAFMAIESHWVGRFAESAGCTNRLVDGVSGAD